MRRTDGEFRSSLRSGGSSSTGESDPRERIKDWLRKFVAFVFAQVGVGGLVVCYAIFGALGFMSLETQEASPLPGRVAGLRGDCLRRLWTVTAAENVLDEGAWRREADAALKQFQDGFARAVADGHDGRAPDEVWSFPAALMYCLSVFTMIGYGNLAPRTAWGKGVTVAYAGLGIPIYVLYFLNMGRALARTFKWLYALAHDCGRDKENGSGSTSVRRRPIVPTTACLWAMSLYVLAGTIMFAEWEGWDYLDSAYFCVTSLCKIGFGDLVPGANISDSREGSQTKLVINFVYVLFGMGLIAMCYNLTKEEVTVKAREIREDARQCFEDTQARMFRCLGITKAPRRI